MNATQTKAVKATKPRTIKITITTEDGEVLDMQRVQIGEDTVSIAVAELKSGGVLLQSTAELFIGK